MKSVIFILMLSVLMLSGTCYSADKTFLYADANQNNKLDGDEAIVVMAADDYARLINPKVPLERMLRGQIHRVSYVALNQEELLKADKNGDLMVTTKDGETISRIRFVLISGHIKVDYIRGTAELSTYGIAKVIVLDHASKKTLNGKGAYKVLLENGKTFELKTAPQESPWIGL